MGSSGAGMVGAYSEGGAGSYGGAGFGGSDSRDLSYIKLEDVEISEYYLKYENVPGVGENVELLTTVVNKRLVVGLVDPKIIIGNMPVTYNFLKIKMNKGKKYNGTVVASGLSPIPYIVVNLYEYE